MQVADGVVSRLDTLPMNNIAHLLATARECGVDLESQLRSAGLDRRCAERGIGDLSREQYYGFLELALPDIAIPAFGIKVGQRFSLGDYGVLGYACISSPTIRQFLQTFFRFQQIVGSSAGFNETLREEGRQAMIEIHSSCVNAQLFRFDVEEAAGQWSVGVRDLLRDIGPFFTRVNLTIVEPGDSAEIQALLGCPVFYQQPRNEMVFPAHLLDAPLSMANELTAQLCEQQCATILRNLTSQCGLVEQVRRLIINQPGRLPVPEAVADELHMSYRTLRRRLRDEGTSFKEIHNEIRMGLAREYMSHTGLSTQEIAFLLGFSEASNFHRAFRQWFGQTPGDYRRSGAEKGFGQD